ncbi:hypothetical protein F1737_10335 [Methanoplanus sp. FWC-SCC4]|uniref:Uncharacterized protein n=1 Tax=Methanochimaera problematica TaxID=2609417 RepID=A0AA97FGK4_9EURY|nr:hypothetical protein [Methanoplanus sp. FWC-SCC4]WOF17046.1 hypothetical protein F1737_10335 [Methanoplanus sp. FWC-SCC4]
MNDKPIKASDIAKIVRMTEAEVKEISKKYEKIIPSRYLGRVRIYEKSAADVISGIAKMASEGTDREEIISHFGGEEKKQSTKEKVAERIRKNPVLINKKIPVKKREKESGESTPEKNRTQTRREIVSAVKVRSDSDKSAMLELKISKLTARIDKLEAELSKVSENTESEIKNIGKSIDSLQKQIDVISEWTEYFDKNFESKMEFQKKTNQYSDDKIEALKAEIEFLKLPWWKRLSSR